MTKKFAGGLMGFLELEGPADGVMREAVVRKAATAIPAWIQEELYYALQRALERDPDLTMNILGLIGDSTTAEIHFEAKRKPARIFQTFKEG